MALQTLLSLIARLQQVMSEAQGRGLLLDYARKSCGARLALLFELDYERQVLMLLEHSGRPPHPSAFSPEAEPIAIPLDGLFASVLQKQGFVDIANISSDPLSLPEERSFAWPRGRVLLHALRQFQRQGVLVFCFSPAGTRAVLTEQSRQELLICATLLSAYLTQGEDLQAARRIPLAPARKKRTGSRTPDTTQTRSAREREPEASTPLRIEEVLQLLTALCEIGLVDRQKDEQALYEQLLTLLSSAFHAPVACLWRYQATSHELLLQASIGDQQACTDATTAELNRQASSMALNDERTAYGLIAQPESTELVLLWHTLRYHERLLGVLGLVLRQSPALLLDQRLLLGTFCDITAFILLHREQQFAEQQALIDQERGRIAREMHDSVVQDVAHVSQKLDYIQRILEKQPRSALNEIEQARALLNRSLRDLRSGISSLLPIPLEEQEFDEALKALLHEYSLSQPHLKVTYDIDNLALWPQVLHGPIYRFMQEALNNVRKHASASEVNIRIHHIAGLGIVQVRDNGRGFTPGQARGSPEESTTLIRHMGLQVMEERIRQAGGKLEIISKPGEGTVLKARFPLTQSAAILTEREREVLRLLVDGMTNRAISEHLSVSLETVKSHVHHIMQKMHVKDRTQAAVIATRQRWL